MKTYTSTWTSFWLYDLRGPWLTVFIMFIPFILGSFLKDWAFFREEIFYKFLLLSTIISALNETVFRCRVVKVVIDETRQRISVDYRRFFSVRQAHLPFRSSTVDLARKRFLGLKTSQWIAFEDPYGRSYRVTEKKYGFSPEVVRELIREVENITHPKGFKKQG
ncbi:MAG: hypothetical protein EOO01_25420 [Chitinophagaceae bacterium]|nr:MAG: hypothetical protein EOO01_25420 [Chitinophagaceae bacterium]